jgi:hypothetical protein
MKTIGAAVLNEYNEILPYTVRSTKQQCEEYAEMIFPTWDKMKELGCKVIQVEIINIEE